MGDPEALLGAIQSPAQRALLPPLEALVAVIVGYVDHVMDSIGDNLIGVLRRWSPRRSAAAGSSADESNRFVERLLGLELTQAAVRPGRGLRRRRGRAGRAEGLERLWRSDRELPTPAEVDAPGLWLARIDLPRTTA